MGCCLSAGTRRRSEVRKKGMSCAWLVTSRQDAARDAVIANGLILSNTFYWYRDRLDAVAKASRITTVRHKISARAQPRAPHVCHYLNFSPTSVD